MGLERRRKERILCCLGAVSTALVISTRTMRGCKEEEKREFYVV